MFDLQQLLMALNDPNSPARELMLNNLAQSPLDPNAAFTQMQQQLSQEGTIPQAGSGGFANMLDPGSTTPVQPSQFTPMPLTAPNQGAPMTDLNNPNFIPPAIAQATGINPQVQMTDTLMPQESGPPGLREDELRKMLEGIGGLKDNTDGRIPAPPAIAPRGNQWSNFQAGLFQLPPIQQTPSLAQILGG